MRNLKKKISTIGLLTTLMFSFSGIPSASAANSATVPLGAAADFAILAKTGVSTTGTTSVTGDIGLSPAAASYLTGFALTLPTASAFSTSALVTGKLYASDYANPTPANLTTAILDMQTAYTNAMGIAPTVTELGAGNIGGLTLASGVYKWSSNLLIPTDVTLSGNAQDVWIFQVAQNFTISAAAKVVLAGGAKADNIFWVVAGQTSIGTTAVVYGTILDQTAIVLNTGAALHGRALAQTAVTLDASAVSAPTASATPATPATPAVPTVTSAIPATPAVPSTNSQSSQNATINAAGQTSATQVFPRGQAVVLGNGQTVYVNAYGVFTDAQGQALSNSAVSRAATVSVPSPAPVFGQQVREIVNNLGKGSRGSNVTTLQQFLTSQNKGLRARELAMAGASTYFGPLTQSALAEFQASVGIYPPLGNFGPITRAYISSH